MICIAYDVKYRYALPAAHRFPMEKYDLLPEQLLYEGTISEDQIFQPDLLPEADLLLTHEHAYYQSLLSGKLSKRAERKIGFPVRPELIVRGRCIAQGTINCAIHALQQGIALNVAGGTHHAFRNRGEGFCVFNDFAIASNCLLERKLVKRILIVDLDVHQGNGTAKIFSNDPRVFTFSMHGVNNYPLQKERSDLDIGLPDRCDDGTYLHELKVALPFLIDQVEPNLIFYLAGADIIASDLLGRLDLSKAGARERDRIVFKTCQKNEIPVVVSMGGGYSPRVRDVVETHANTFRVAMDLFG